MHLNNFVKMGLAEYVMYSPLHQCGFSAEDAEDEYVIGEDE